MFGLLDLVFGVGLAFCLAGCLFLLIFLREVQADVRELSEDMKRLTYWHIHVAAKLDIPTALEEKDDGEWTPESGHEEASEQ